VEGIDAAGRQISYTRVAGARRDDLNDQAGTRHGADTFWAAGNRTLTSLSEPMRDRRSSRSPLMSQLCDVFSLSRGTHVLSCC